MDFTTLFVNIGNWIVTEGLKALVAFIVLLILFKITNVICRKLAKLMRKKKLDEAVVRVSETWARRGIKFVLFIVFIAYLGFETSSITAAIASLGVTIGLALQGSLSNIAGGIVLLVMHPYRVGDEIEIEGNTGTVEDIKLFYTYLRTSDNKLIVIPNSTAANDEIINYSTKPTRRVDLIFSISYDSDYETAKALIIDCVKGLGHALEDPAPFVGMEAHAQSSVDVIVKYWVPTNVYYDSRYMMREAVKLAFDANGIEIPYPQLEVHTKSDGRESK
ncbi:MAG TPA: mechanosensitive ion channel [Candidatus Ornithoclostridium excrementipullorum]|nr:mechanosensitive ion channel [Candidatus Ornithoclostridium excrementipullorum]